MSNWKERLSKAFQTRLRQGALDAEREKLVKQQRLELEQHWLIDRQERLASFQRTVDALQIRDMLEKVRVIWKVGSISEEKPRYKSASDEYPTAGYILQYSRAGSAECFIGRGGPDNSTNDMVSRRGTWTDSVGFDLHDGDNMQIYYWEGHSFDPNRGSLIKGQEWSTGMQHATVIINRPGHLEVFKNGKSAEVSIESILLELCEQRILNKQLPLDYKY